MHTAYIVSMRMSSVISRFRIYYYYYDKLYICIIITLYTYEFLVVK